MMHWEGARGSVGCSHCFFGVLWIEGFWCLTLLAMYLYKTCFP